MRTRIEYTDTALTEMVKRGRAGRHWQGQPVTMDRIDRMLDHRLWIAADNAAKAHSNEPDQGVAQ